MTIEQTIEILPDRRLVMDLPNELPVGRAKVELTITPETTRITQAGESAFGCLNRFADPTKISGERGAWERAVIRKYAKN